MNLDPTGKPDYDTDQFVPPPWEDEQDCEPVIMAAPDMFVDPKEGLRTTSLTNSVMEHVTVGRDKYDTKGPRFWVYRNGVWKPEFRDVERVVTLLLGERHRRSHISHVRDRLHAVTEYTIAADPHPDYVNCRNGLLEWRTGELHRHRPDVLSTVQLPVNYNAEADCPNFHKFLAEILPEDCVTPIGGGPAFIWQLLGYLVFSGNPWHKAILLRGTGRNGKGTLLDVVTRLLGQENLANSSLDDLTVNRFRSATLLGKLANIAGDIDTRWISEGTGLFKQLTGGDTIAAEHKYGDAFEFTPWAVPVFSANDDFGSDDHSIGWISRWLVVPFPNDFSDSTISSHVLRGRLTTENELQGILRHAVDAIPHVIEHGFTEPETVDDAKRQFIERGNKHLIWLRENCELGTGPEFWEPRTALHAHFTAFIENDGGAALSKQEFYSRLDGVSGLSRRKRHGVEGFAGVRILRAWSQ